MNWNEPGNTAFEQSCREAIPAAVAAIKARGRASTAVIQRSLRIGYNRAARIMEILEELRLIGPEIDYQPRAILPALETFDPAATRAADPTP